MEMNLENLGLESLQNQLDKDGYVILKNFFDKEFILHLKNLSQEIFRIQFDYFEYDDTFEHNMIRLFNEQEEVFKNCGKLIQTGLIPLYQLASDNQLLNQIMELGVQYPNMCTRPVLFFNHPQLAKEKVYYKTPNHQDWPSMEASLNSLVVWVPLVNVNELNGSIIIYPGSHKQGVLPFNVNGGFAEVEYEGESIQPEMEVGDIVIFSTFLVHKSGDILDNSIRWSCHFRYTDMLEKDFINRGYPNPYIYKPTTKQ
jgi:ectoine hydroxylase-related dioxygenase (phytanoyl-CoA dioxygenase family)